MTARDHRVAFDAGTDPVEHARLLSRTYTSVLAGDGPAPLRPRELILYSWRRATRAGVDPERHLAPVPFEHAEVLELRRGHPLAVGYPLLKDVVGRLCDDSQQVMVVTDAQGQILWLDGHPRVKRYAEDIHFVEGAVWSEEGAATNAIGTALVVDHPVQVFSAEHFLRRQHLWTCSACPIHDPDTGAALGVIDLSGPLRTAHPDSVALVESAAMMVEGLLRQRQLERDDELRDLFLERMLRAPRAAGAVVTASGRVLLDEPRGWAGSHVDVPLGGGPTVVGAGAEVIAETIARGRGYLLWRTDTGRFGDRRPAALSLRMLGSRHPVATLGGAPLPLTRRAAEVLCLLALSPEGLSADELAERLYGPGGNPISARAEVSRVRKLLGPWLGTKPYRLLGRVDADFVEVARLAAAGRTEQARARCGGELLPGSGAPAVVAAREGLQAALLGATR
ncbi:MAG: hypothetical protein QOI64_1933 [Solirubrobacteraceae bacterium]|nr:hypothetical protein [Solirubrobacteraceae bacterium]